MRTYLKHFIVACVLVCVNSLLEQFSIDTVNPFCEHVYRVSEKHLNLIRLQCRNFESWSQLDFRKNKKQGNVVLNPKNEISLDKTFSLTGLNSAQNILFYRIYKIDVFSKPFTKGFNYERIQIYYSNLKFVSNQQIANSDMIFTDLNIGTLEFYKCKFNNKLPANAFDNSIISSLEFSRSDSFSPFEDTANVTNENSPLIDELSISFSSTKFNSSLLNRHVYKNLQKLTIEWTDIDNIAPDIQLYFPRLNHIKIDIYALESSNGAWLSTLNSCRHLDLNTNTLRTDKDAVYFEFDYDSALASSICLFKQFPHHNMVIPVLSEMFEITCNCNLYWIFQYHDKYKFDNYNKYNSLFTEKCGGTLSQEILKCNFESIFKLCDNGLPKVNLNRLHDSNTTKLLSNCTNTTLNGTTIVLDYRQYSTIYDVATKFISIQIAKLVIKLNELKSTILDVIVLFSK